MGTSLSNLGNALSRKEDYAEARRSIERARVLWVKAYGEEHARVASLDLNLGQLASAQQAWDEAVTHFERALGGFEAALGPEHVKTTWTRFQLGEAELERGQLERAKPLIEQAHHALEAMPHEIYRRAFATFGLARLRAAEGHRDQARVLAGRAKTQTKALEVTDVRGPELRAQVDAWLKDGVGGRSR